MSSQKLARKWEKGQSLVEAVIALGVAVIAITALINLSLVAVRSAQSGRNNLTGQNLANQCLEIVRALRDDSWSNLPEEGTYYLSEAGNIESEESEGEIGIYTRKLDIGDVAAEKKQVTCTILWTEGNEEKQVRVATYLTNWNE